MFRRHVSLFGVDALMDHWVTSAIVGPMNYRLHHGIFILMIKHDFCRATTATITYKLNTKQSFLLIMLCSSQSDKIRQN